MLKYVLIATLALIGTIIAAPQQGKGVDDSFNLITNQPTGKTLPTNTGTGSIPNDPNEIDILMAEISNNLTKYIDNVDNNNSNNNFELNGKLFGQSGNIFGSNNQNDGNCECVPYYQCRNNIIVDDGTDIIGVRSHQVSSSRLMRPCEDSLHVCCMPPSIKRGPETTVTLPPFEQRGCGQRNAEGIGFSIKGAENGESQFGEFPWMVAILKKERNSKNGEKMNEIGCGGSLIHPQVVLTVASCVFDKSPLELEIRAGEWDTQTENEILPHQDRDVQRTIIPENYSVGAFRNEYALLILKQPVVLAHNVDVVCLPDPGAVFDGKRCFASGWGKDSSDIMSRRNQFILKRVELPIVNHNQCQFKLRQIGLLSNDVLHPSFICAGGELGKDTCKGDGGSPLVCPLRNRYVQAGSVAFGVHPCGENGVPGVYANIAAGRQWIDDKMNSLGFGTASYVY